MESIGAVPHLSVEVGQVLIAGVWLILKFARPQSVQVSLQAPQSVTDGDRQGLHELLIQELLPPSGGQLMCHPGALQRLGEVIVPDLSLSGALQILLGQPLPKQR